MSKKSILKDILCNGVVRYSNARTYLLIIWIICFLAASFCFAAVVSVSKHVKFTVS